MVRIASIYAILLDPRIFILQRQREGRWGWGLEVNGHAHRHVLILPLSFGVKASLGDDSS